MKDFDKPEENSFNDEFKLCNPGLHVIRDLEIMIARNQIPYPLSAILLYKYGACHILREKADMADGRSSC